MDSITSFKVGDILKGNFAGVTTICLLEKKSAMDNHHWIVLAIESDNELYIGQKGSFSEHTLRQNLHKKIRNDKLLAKLYA